MAKSNEREALSGQTDRAQPLRGPHAAPLKAPGKNSLPLAALDGQRVTLKMPIGGQARLVTGTATYEPRVGLSILLDDDITEIHLDETMWSGSIFRQSERVSGYLIALDAQAASPQATR